MPITPPLDTVDIINNLLLTSCLTLLLGYIWKYFLKNKTHNLKYRDKLIKDASRRLGYNLSISAEQARINIEKQRQKIEAAKQDELIKKTHTSRYYYHYQQDVLSEMNRLYNKKFPVEPCSASSN